LSLHDAPVPDAAVEVAPHHVAGARLERRGGRPVLPTHAREPLPPGVVVPSLTAVNVHDRAAVATALSRVLERIGRPRRIGLVVPDGVARVSLLRFEHVPARREDLDQLIRWQVRKAAPFPIEDAQISYQWTAHTAEGHEFLVVLARRAVVEEYEGLAAVAGAHAGLVDISALNVINAVLAEPSPPSGDWMLVNVASDAASVAILRGGTVVLFRSRSAEGDATLQDMVHQSAMYYEDRLQGAGFDRILLSGASLTSSGSTAGGAADAADLTRRTLEARLGRPVEFADPFAAAALTDRIGATGVLLDTLAPLVGMLLRGKAPRRAGEGAAA
jgi:Tfp pilus assembly PilM family ATPase